MHCYEVMMEIKGGMEKNRESDAKEIQADGKKNK